MNRTDIERYIERVFLEKWDYAGGDPGYFQAKAQQVEAFRRGLQGLTGRAVRVERPANLQNFFRLEVCFSPGMDGSRDELAYESVRAQGEVIYLEISCSVILPLSEGRWRRFTVPERMLVQDVHDLLSDEWFAVHPEHEEIACGVLHLGEEHGLAVVPSEILRCQASATLPVPFPGNSPATIRDFVFPGVLD